MNSKKKSPSLFSVNTFHFPIAEIEGYKPGQQLGASVAISPKNSKYIAALSEAEFTSESGEFLKSVSTYKFDKKSGSLSITAFPAVHPDHFLDSTNYGYALAIHNNGKYLFVTQPNIDEIQNTENNIYIYKKNEDKWELLSSQTLDVSDEHNLSLHGLSLDLDKKAKTLLVGSGENKDRITHIYGYNFNKKTGDLTLNKTVSIQNGQSHDQLDNRHDVGRKAFNVIGIPEYSTDRSQLGGKIEVFRSINSSFGLSNITNDDFDGVGLFSTNTPNFEISGSIFNKDSGTKVEASLEYIPLPNGENPNGNEGLTTKLQTVTDDNRDWKIEGDLPREGYYSVYITAIDSDQNKTESANQFIRLDQSSPAGAASDGFYVYEVDGKKVSSYKNFRADNPSITKEDDSYEFEIYGFASPNDVVTIGYETKNGYQDFATINADASGFWKTAYTMSEEHLGFEDPDYKSISFSRNIRSSNQLSRMPILKGAWGSENAELGNELILYKVDNPNDSTSFEEIARTTYTDGIGTWTLAVEDYLEPGDTYLAFEVIDAAGNSSGFHPSSTASLPYKMEVIQETSDLHDPNINPVISNNDLLQTAKALSWHHARENEPFITNYNNGDKAKEKKIKPLVMSKPGSVPWLLLKAYDPQAAAQGTKYLSEFPYKSQGTKDLTRMTKVYKLLEKQAKSWSNHKLLYSDDNLATFEETFGFNLLNSLLATTKGSSEIWGVIHDNYANKNNSAIKDFYSNLAPDQINRIKFPADISLDEMRDSSLSGSKLLENHKKILLHNQTKPSEHDSQININREQIKMLKGRIEKLTDELKYRNRPRWAIESREKKIKAAKASIKSLNDDTSKRLKEIDDYKQSGLANETDRFLVSSDKLSRSQRNGNKLKIASPILSGISNLWNWRISTETDNESFQTRQFLDLSKNLADLANIAVETNKNKAKRYLGEYYNIDPESGKVSRKISRFTTAFDLASTGFELAAGAVNIIDYSNELKRLQAKDCNLLNNFDNEEEGGEAVQSCEKEKKRDIQAYSEAMVWESAGTSLNLMSGINDIAVAKLGSTGAKSAGKLSKFLGKAAPVLGVISTTVSLIDPVGERELEKGREDIAQVRLKIGKETSAKVLAEALQNQQDVKQDYFTAKKITEGAFGYAAAAAAMIPGKGTLASIAISALGEVTLLAMEYAEAGALAEVSKELATAIKTDEDGNVQTVDDFIGASFDKQQEDLRNEIDLKVEQIFNSENSYQEVININTQFTTESDRRSLANANLGDELGSSVKHYMDSKAKCDNSTDDDCGEWESHDQSISPTKSVMDLPESAAQNRMVKFFSPLNIGGKEKKTSEEEGKNEWVNKLKIEDISGWTINDTSANSTFDLSNNFVTHAISEKDGPLFKFPLKISGNDGKDVLFGGFADIHFDGGNNIDLELQKDEYDSVSYTDFNLVDKLVEGIIIFGASNDQREADSIEFNKSYREGEFEYWLNWHLNVTPILPRDRKKPINIDGESITKADYYQRIKDHIETYQGYESDNQFNEKSALVIKPLTPGVKYLRNRIISKEFKEDGKGGKTEKTEYQEVISETNNSFVIGKDHLINVEIISTTPNDDYIDLTGLEMVKILLTQGGNDHIFSGNSELDMYIDSGEGDDEVWITNRPQAIELGEGDDKVYLSSEFFDYKVEKLTVGTNKRGPLNIHSYIDGGPGYNEVYLTHKFLEGLTRDFQEHVFHNIRSQDLFESYPESEGASQKIVQVLEREHDASIQLQNIDRIIYKLPSDKNEWMPKLRAEEISQHSQQMDLAFQSPFLNGVSTGVSDMDSMIFIEDFNKLYELTLDMDWDALIHFDGSDSSVPLTIIDSDLRIHNKTGSTLPVLINGSNHDDTFIHKKAEIKTNGGNDIIIGASDGWRRIRHQEDGHHLFTSAYRSDLDAEHRIDTTWSLKKLRIDDDLVIYWGWDKGSITVPDFFDFSTDPDYKNNTRTMSFHTWEDEEYIPLFDYNDLEDEIYSISSDEEDMLEFLGPGYVQMRTSDRAKPILDYDLEAYM